MTGLSEPNGGIAPNFGQVMGLAGVGLALVWVGAALLWLSASGDPSRYQALIDGARSGLGLARLKIPQATAPVSPPVAAAVCPPCAIPPPVIQIVAGDTQPVLEDWLERQAEVFRQALVVDREGGALEILRPPGHLLIRLPERGAFLPGRALPEPAFLDVLQRLAVPLAKVPGVWRILAHTDNAPLQTSHFSSHWELSAQRAVAVLQVLLQNPALSSGRFRLEALADLQPLMPNDSVEHRAMNRRIELVWEAAAAAATIKPHQE